MEIIRKDFDPIKGEYSIEIQAQDRKINVWVETYDMNLLTDDDFMDVCKCVFNETKDFNGKESEVFGCSPIEFDNLNVVTEWCIDETDTLNIDKVMVVSDDEYNRVFNELCKQGIDNIKKEEKENKDVFEHLKKMLMN